MLLCRVAHFLRRLYRVCGNKPSDIAARFLLKSLCLLVLQCSFSWENGPAIIYDAMCFETIFHRASPFQICISRDVQFKIPSKLPNCQRNTRYVHKLLWLPGRTRLWRASSFFWALREVAWNQKIISVKRKGKASTKAFILSVPMLGFQDYNISKLKLIRLLSHLIRSCFNGLWQSPLLRYNSPKLLGRWGNCMKTYQ